MAITTLERAVVRAEPWPADECAPLPLPVWVEPARPVGRPARGAERLAEVIQLRPDRRPVVVAESPVRLTRRGRLTLGVAAMACTLAVAGLAFSSAGATPSQPATAPGASVVVAPGDTVWEIAVRADPQADPRVTVARIVELNDLSGGQIRPGQRLFLPSNQRPS